MTYRTTPLTIDETARLQRKVDRMGALLQRYKHNRSVQNAMLQLSELASAVTDMFDFYSAIHGVVGQLLRAENFYVVQVSHAEQDECYVPAYFADQAETLSMEDLHSDMFKEGLTGFVYRTGRTLLCDEALSAKMAKNGDIVAHGADCSHWMGVPLIRDNQPFGVMAVQTYDDTHYSAADQELLEFISLHLVTAIDRIKQRELLEHKVLSRTRALNQLNQDLQVEISERQRAEALQSTLFKISQITATAVLMDDFYQSIHRVLKTLIYADNCYIGLLSNDGKRLSFPFYVDSKNERGRPRPFGRGLTEYVISKGEACLINADNLEQLEHDGVIYRRQHDRANYNENSTSWLGAPLIVNDCVIGVIASQVYENKHVYSNKDLEVLRFVSHHLAVAIQRKLASDDLRSSHDELENKVLTRTQELRQSNLFLKLQIEERKKAEEKLFFEANHDALTSLPNRKMLLQQLAKALGKIKGQRKSDEPVNENKDGTAQIDFAVLFIDLDRFKIINDTLGHHAGDEFLIEVSLRIAGCIREQDILARLGGDEFVILLNEVQCLDDIEEISERIITSVALPFYINNQEVYSGASIGVVQSNDSYLSADDLLRDADAAMYQAKNMGRGRFIVFDETMHQRLMDDLTVEQALHKVVKSQLISPEYNPLYNIHSGEILGSEAQVYWQHPLLRKELGDIEAAQLIELARNNGVIIQIDQLMLQQICQQMKPEGRLADVGLVSIHVSSMHLSQSKSLQQLLAIVKAAGIDAHKLCFAFEEACLLSLIEANANEVGLSGFKRIKNSGISIAIQGFGAGLSSLGLLTQNNIDYVKTDPSFTRSLLKNDRNKALLQTLMTLSGTFNFKVILDGIDSEALQQLADEHQVLIGAGKYFVQRAAEKLAASPPKLTLHNFG